MTTFATGLRLGGDLNEASARGESWFPVEDISADSAFGITTPVRRPDFSPSSRRRCQEASTFKLLYAYLELIDGKRETNFRDEERRKGVTCMRLACRHVDNFEQLQWLRKLYNTVNLPYIAC